MTTKEIPLRLHFAGMALNGILANHYDSLFPEHHEKIVRDAFNIADELIKQARIQEAQNK